jgi:hypothetical protein
MAPPRTMHVTLVDLSDWLIPMITEFLDIPVPEQKNGKKNVI